MSGRYELERKAAIHAVRMASSLCRRVQDQLVTEDSITKKDRSPVTVADYGSQALVCRHLAEAVPQDPVVGEESTEALRGEEQGEIRERVVQQVNGEVPGASVTQVLDWIDRAQDAGGRHRFWTLDPIDGTKGFLRGQQYAVALALLIVASGRSSSDNRRLTSMKNTSIARRLALLYSQARWSSS